VFTILALISALNGLLTWIGRGFGIHALTIQLVVGYIFYPLSSWPPSSSPTSSSPI
jgi:CNT family concentrative nucleoside transporter